MTAIAVTVNGARHDLVIDASTTLLSLLRDELMLTGTKEGCVEGECGACTVLIDGVPVDSCIYAAAAADGRRVTTIEGLGDPEQLTALQAALVRSGGVQCGFCTPGIVVTLTALLDENPWATADEIRSELSGNLCRCTGYAQIVEAVLEVVGTDRS